MVSVILLMAGKGSRMGYKDNKILMPINDKLIFEYPLNTFLNLGLEVICVISKENEDKIVPKLPKNVKYTYGGKERSDSVYNGLKIASGDYIFVHDAARAFISKETIKTLIELKDESDAILTYLPVKDTIKEKTLNGLITLNRSNLIAAATPQCAKASILKEAYKKAKEDNYKSTDDISLIEKYFPNIEIKCVQANEEDFKITTPLDYKLAMLIRGEEND